MLRPYTLRRRPWSRGISLRVRHTGEIVVSAPRLLPKYFIESYLEKQSTWLDAALAKVAQYQATHTPATYTLAQKKQLKQDTETKVMPRLYHYAHILGVSWAHVSFKHLSSRWGSCARNGNLSFNSKMALLPDHLIDYVVAHELSHRIQFNHSAKFWAVVASVYPDYKSARKELKSHQAK